MRTLAVDKTGTLTEGAFRIQQVALGPAGGTMERLLELAAGVEQLSSHPIAAAFLQARVLAAPSRHASVRTLLFPFRRRALPASCPLQQTPSRPPRTAA